MVDIHKQKADFIVFSLILPLVTSSEEFPGLSPIECSILREGKSVQVIPGDEVMLHPRRGFLVMNRQYTPWENVDTPDPFFNLPADGYNSGKYVVGLKIQRQREQLYQEFNKRGVPETSEPPPTLTVPSCLHEDSTAQNTLQTARNGTDILVPPANIAARRAAKREAAAARDASPPQRRGKAGLSSKAGGGSGRVRKRSKQLRAAAAPPSD